MSEAPFRILVVEDEALVALLLQELLTELGHVSLGPAAGVREALQMVGSLSFDAALLDINLGGERSDAVADALAGRGVPFAFVTGSGREVRPQDAHRPVLNKPFVRKDLAALVAELRSRAA